MAGSEKVDIVYPLGTKSRWDDNELRYSLRSVHEFVNVGKIFIVGHKPEWITNIHHVDAQDYAENKKNHNIIYKTICGAGASEADHFIKMSDDHIIINQPDFNPYRIGSLPSSCSRDDDQFTRSSVETFNYLSSKSLPTHSYEAHCPVIINRRRFIDVFNHVELFRNVGYVIMSMYLNHIGVFEPEPGHHVLRLRTMDFSENIDDFTFMNFNDFSLSEKLKRYLFERFPNKSPYER